MSYSTHIPNIYAFIQKSRRVTTLRKMAMCILHSGLSRYLVCAYEWPMVLVSRPELCKSPAASAGWPLSQHGWHWSSACLLRTHSYSVPLSITAIQVHFPSPLGCQTHVSFVIVEAEILRLIYGVAIWEFMAIKEKPHSIIGWLRKDIPGDPFLLRNIPFG